jgi:hypothetical protein
VYLRTRGYASRANGRPARVDLALFDRCNLLHRVAASGGGIERRGERGRESGYDA